MENYENNPFITKVEKHTLNLSTGEEKVEVIYEKEADDDNTSYRPKSNTDGGTTEN